MIGFLVRKIFGSKNDRFLKKLRPLVAKINALEPEMQALADEELPQRLAVYREQVQNGEKDLDAVLPEVFALVREASTRVLGMRHYDVQLLGAMALHNGKIAEMKTGEGKTLVATLAVILNSLEGKGVHVVTVNDYLAKRDAEWMGRLYNFLGLSVGVIVAGLSDEQRKEAYGADITYGTNNEFGFDYLRDNMKFYAEQLVQRGHHYAIVDEVDSILIDEARTPLIISGMGDKSTQLYDMAESLVARMKKYVVAEVDSKEEEAEDIDADYVVDEKAKTATLTARGIAKAEEFFNLENLSDPENTTLSHHINQAIRARGLMKRDIDYVVKDGEVIIVDEFTGRLMYGRRYNDGLHQAIEAKEGVTVARESKTLATITFQNYFRLYKKLSGMTGTALTEEEEFSSTYQLDIVEVPTNKPMIRVDHPDEVYKNTTGKYHAIVRQIVACHEKGQPVLAGTTSIEKSEILSRLLDKEGIKHNVLNAKNHEKEAEIIAQAGKFGAVTVATNMAGRGTDIMLGGNAEFLAKNDLKKAGFTPDLIAEATGFAETDNETILKARKMFSDAEDKYRKELAPEADKVREAGGLFILGPERHESRRIDNQLRGRSGRQGDPGESRFYISLEDDLMRLFGSEKLMSVFSSLGVAENEQIEHKMLSSAIEKAQRKIESNNYGIRKNLLEYDQVNNEQREIIYKERRRVLDGDNMRDAICKMITDTVENTVDMCISDEVDSDEWDLIELNTILQPIIPVKTITKEDVEGIRKNQLKQNLKEEAIKLYEVKEAEFAEPEQIRELERVVLLKVIDRKWMDHIDDMEQLRQGIGLQAYGQRDPKVEYKMSAFEMFDEMIAGIQQDTVRLLYHVRIEQKVEREQVAEVTGTNKDEEAKGPVRRAQQKVYPNDPCPCGSGKKYKQCCGRKPV